MLGRQGCARNFVLSLSGPLGTLSIPMDGPRSLKRRWAAGPFVALNHLLCTIAIAHAQSVCD